MKQFLERIGLVDYLTTELEMTKNDFVSRLSKHVDKGSTSAFADSFDVFSSSKNEYKGYVGYDDFKIKRRRKFFDSASSLAVAQGTYRQMNDKLVIQTKINGFSKMFIPLFILFAIFYVGIIIAILVSGNSDESPPFFMVPFILLHGVFMLLIPYFVMKRGVKRLKHELEREFYFMTKG